MIVPKLLHVVVQPVYVLVDTETLDVTPGPAVQPTQLPAAAVPDLAGHLTRVALEIAGHLASTLAASETVESAPVDVSPDAP